MIKHAKYGVSISYGSKVITKFKSLFLSQTHRQMGQKLDSSEFYWGVMEISRGVSTLLNVV